MTDRIYELYDVVWKYNDHADGGSYGCKCGGL